MIWKYGSNVQALQTVSLWSWFRLSILGLMETLPPMPAISDIPDNPEFFLDCRGFPVTADENGRRIWILYVKIHYIDINFNLV